MVCLHLTIMIKKLEVISLVDNDFLPTKRGRFWGFLKTESILRYTYTVL